MLDSTERKPSGDVEPRIFTAQKITDQKQQNAAHKSLTKTHLNDINTITQLTSDLIHPSTAEYIKNNDEYNFEH